MLRKPFLILLAILLILSVLAFGEENERRIALVIGNSEYQTSPLRNPVNDAEDISIALESLGFTVSTKLNATKRGMSDAIHTFGRDLMQGGVGLFYYAGHGMQVDGRNYLIPVGADIQAEDEVEFEAIDAGLVLNKMESATNRVNLVFLDACRDNPFARSFRSEARGLAIVDAPKGSLVVYATAPGSVAADGQGSNGVFTAALLQHIQTEDIDVEIMLKLVRADVSIASGGEQVPWSSSSLSGRFLFSSSNTVDMVVESPTISKSEAKAQLYVVTDPDRAEISVDGEKKGESPILLTDLPVRRDLLIEAKTGIMLGEKIVHLQSGELTDVLIELEPARGNLIISSSERDVEVFIDGVLMGVFGTGLIKDIESGQRLVELKGIGLYGKELIDIPFDGVAQVRIEVKKALGIGDTGPAGGLIFYDKGSFSEGWRWLEAAPRDQSTGIEWGGRGTSISGTSVEVGTGEANTEKIVRKLGNGTYAVQLCYDLEQGGYDDWFLPSKDELNLMYRNLQLKGMGGFAAANYWSSSEYGSYVAWIQYFYNGIQYNDSSKNNDCRVRAVRAF